MAENFSTIAVAGALQLTDNLVVGQTSSDGKSTLATLLEFIESTGLDFDGDVTVGGNFTVSGTTTTVDTTELLVEDNMITVNKNQTGTPMSTLVSGIEVERGDETNYRFVFTEDDDTFRIGEVASEQAVATREDAPTDEGVAFWNDTDKRFDTSSTFVYDGTNVGIGTTNPVNLLDITNTTTQPAIVINDARSVAAGIGGVLRLGGRYADSRGVDELVYSEIAGYKETAVDGEYGYGLKFTTYKQGGLLEERMRIDGSGNVGIGDISPDVPLSVACDASGAYVSYIHNENAAGHGLLVKSGTTAAHTPLAVFDKNAGSLQLHIKAAGTNGCMNGAWTNSSDERLKANITEISNPIDKAISIANCVRHYNYKEELNISEGQKTQYIAQLLQANGFGGHVTESVPPTPDAGRLFGWEYDEDNKVTVEGTKTFAVEQNFTPYAFPAIKALNEKIDAQQVTIDAQQVTIDAQQTTINSLIARIEALEN